MEGRKHSGPTPAIRPGNAPTPWSVPASNLGTLVEEITIDNPGACTVAFTIRGSNRLLPQKSSWNVCNENEKGPASS